MKSLDSGSGSPQDSVGQFVNLYGVTSASAGTPCRSFGVPARCLSHPTSWASLITGRPFFPEWFPFENENYAIQLVFVDSIVMKWM